MNLKKIFCVTFILSLFMSTAAKANKEDDEKSNPILIIGAVETVFAVNSWIASKEPNIYGAACIFLFPFAALKSENQVVFWTSLVASESLAFYNLMLDNKKYSESDIFINNMIFWHLITVVVGISALLPEDLLQNKSFIFKITSDERSNVKIGLSYKF